MPLDLVMLITLPHFPHPERNPFCIEQHGTGRGGEGERSWRDERGRGEEGEGGGEVRGERAVEREGRGREDSERGGGEGRGGGG